MGQKKNSERVDANVLPKLSGTGGPSGEVARPVQLVLVVVLSRSGCLSATAAAHVSGLDGLVLVMLLLLLLSVMVLMVVVVVLLVPLCPGLPGGRGRRRGRRRGRGAGRRAAAAVAHGGLTQGLPAQLGEHRPTPMATPRLPVAPSLSLARLHFGYQHHFTAHYATVLFEIVSGI